MSSFETAVAKLNQFSTGKYNGRDKFAKAMQFGGQLITYHMLKDDPKNELALKIVLFFKQLAVSRKALRLFKSVEELHKMNGHLSKAKGVNVDLVLNITTNVGMFFRWGTDNLAFFEKIKVLPKGSEWGLRSNKFRCISTVAFLILCLKKLVTTNNKCNELASSKDEKAVTKAADARFEAVLGLFARVCDMTNAMHGAHYNRTNDGLQGACGLISSLLAIRKVVKAMK